MEDSNQPRSAEEDDVAIPQRRELEERFAAKIVTYEDRGEILPGGQCGCCGSGPNVAPDYRGEPWYVYRAGLCDSDGVYYSQLCEGCLEDVRAENASRTLTERDELAKEITELLADDIDGAQSMMEDLDL